MNESADEGAVLLLVDDKAENLTSLKGILQHSGYGLLTATSGEEGLKIVLREKVTVILLDVLMPKMDGYEVARHLKGLERTRDIPILFLTAMASDARQIYRAYEVGAVDYLVKPLDPEIVRRKVAVFVELVRQREQIERQAEALREADHREHELQLAELRLAGDRRYRKLVEGIDHALGWTNDETLRFTFISRQAPRILGYRTEQFLEPDFWSKHLHPEDRSSVMDMFRRALDEGVELVCNHRVVAADGRIVWLHTGVSGERGVGRAPSELHGISVDVTEIKHAQEAAQRATHVREELLAIVAHDLRNPLNAIEMGAATLERIAERSQEAPALKTARTILRSAQRMEHLISDLLDFALIQAERVTITRQTLDADDLIQESLEMFEPLAKEKGVRIEGEAPAELRLSGDRDRVLQVLSNLMGNALKFTPAGGSVVLRAERVDGEARFAISDTGSGISEQDVPHVWERYWQAKRKADGGVGLGLSIAKGLVQAHGGRIWVESKLGSGTTFFFTLPLSPADASRENEARTADAT
jgi:PAS domain S-box-containing protein